MFASKDLFFTQPSGYQISRSVRIRQSASAYFNRTFATPTSNQKMTLSCWVKIGSTSQTAGQLTLLNGGNGTQVNASNSFIQLRTDGTALKLQILCNGGGAATVGGYRTFAPYYRDNSAWYHIVLAADTTQATAANRYRGYVNGVEITSYTGVDPDQNVNITWLNTAVEHLIGKNNEGGGPVYSDTYITEMYWIDGQQLTPTSFGQFNSVTGVWQPKRYAGTYGTNGFYLNFSDNSGVTATTIGKDYSGNSNNWTPNNISITAGATYDSMTDVPTLYADGGNGRGNYAVLNAVQESGTLIDGNLRFTGLAGSYTGRKSTIAIPSSGKWYWETNVTTQNGAIGNWFIVGMCTGSLALTAYTGGVVGAISYGDRNDGRHITNETTTISNSAVIDFATGDVLQCAYDVGTGKFWFGRNNSWFDSSVGTTGNPAAGTNQTLTAAAKEWFPYLQMNEANNIGDINFGQRPFAYTPPTGFVALNTQNLPAPTITNGANYMAATLYTGNGGTQSITNTVNGVSFQPDLVWNKARSSATSHNLTDSVRGVQKSLFSNLSNAELASCELTAFNSNGYTLVRDAARAEQNENTVTYVGWQWNAGGSTVTNTSGSISAQVRANPTAGFSIVTYTGNGTNPGATIGHGLGVTPAMIIAKSRNAVGEWPSYHQSLPISNTVYPNAIYASSTFLNRFSAVSSTTFTTGSSGSELNTNGTTYVAYCFSAVAGYSAFSSYTGNGSADGPFVFTNFRPRWVMIKRTDANENWQMYDTSRNTSNVVGEYLLANSSGAGATITVLDFLSNGFKIRVDGTNPGVNTSGGTYIYMAFAENPFKLSLAR